MSRIKILYIIGSLDVGGTETQLVDLVSLLDRSRFEPMVCSLSSDGPLGKLLKTREIPVHVLGFRGFRRLPRGYLKTAPEAIRALVRLWLILRKQQPHIVHGFLFWAYVLGAFCARVSRVPIILASRRSLGYFKASKWHYLFLERVANRMTHVVTANSEAVKQDAVMQEGLPASRITVVYNGLELGRFDVRPNEVLRRNLALRKRAPVIGVIANFIQYKGHQFFLDAWATVIEKCPDAVALLLGDGPLRKELEMKVEETGLRESVRFLGTRHDVPELLALMDLVVHPSLEEGFSNAILEAMAAGKPVVATDVGGNPEAVIDGETGLLVPPRDSQALADAMLWVLDHPEEAARFGQAGRRRVADHFEISKMVRQYEELYERLVSEKCPRFKQKWPWGILTTTPGRNDA